MSCEIKGCNKPQKLVPNGYGQHFAFCEEHYKEREMWRMDGKTFEWERK